MAKEKRITQTTIIHQYGISKKNIERFLPKPDVVPNPYYRTAPPMLLWKKEDVERALQENPELAKSVQKTSNRKAKIRQREQDAMEFLKSFSPQKVLERGSELNRKFELHVGPTNSGKTYCALQRLKESCDGLYLGPLRLLALEVSETLMADGYPCSLLTGEEYINVPNSLYTASTIELCDYDHHYETVVIDEAQMIADAFRGHHWFKALCLVNADTIVVCCAPEAQNLLEKMCREMGAPYEVIYHERMVPLQYSGEFDDIHKVQPGDALIAFGRKKVLQIAAELERSGKKVSVIYGALPPASRREEVRRFSAKETTVVVATDAIGMGVSLPIKRIIFTETKKFNGDDVLPLTKSEIKQISGRAGRFGKYDLGEVLTMSSPTLVKSGVYDQVPQIRKLTIGFPEEALTYERPLGEMLRLWDMLPQEGTFARTDMREAIFLLNYLGRVEKSIPKAFVYELVTCPVDTKKADLVDYWRECCDYILAGEQPPRPHFPEGSLEQCEIKYRAYDVYHQLMRKIGVEDDCVEEKTELCNKINNFLKASKYRPPKKKKRYNDWRY